MLRRLRVGTAFASEELMRPGLETASVSVRRSSVVRDERGAVAVLFAISMVVLFGIVALAGDASLFSEKRNRLSAAADGAAIMAAIEVQRNPSVTNPDLKNFADQVATTHGFAPANVTLNRPPSTGPYAGNSGYVEAILSETSATFFANVWGIRSSTPGARAVAGSSASPGCFITFDDTTLGGSALNASNCDVAIGGDLDTHNQTTITADNVGVTGGWNNRGSVQNIVLSVPPPGDPLALLPAMSDPGGTCTTPLNVSANMTIDPGKYCGFTFSGNNRTLTLNAGNYYITGPITASTPGKDVIITGTGVMIYIAPGGRFDLDSNFVDIDISAPTSGTYKGIAFFQDRANTADAILAKNNSSSDIGINGVMYFPNAHVEMKNNGLTGSPCGLFVGKSLEIKNNATYNVNNTCADFGGSPLQTVSLAE
jgi:Flp pilus assembly protein TadG